MAGVGEILAMADVAGQESLSHDDCDDIVKQLQEEVRGNPEIQKILQSRFQAIMAKKKGG